MTWCGWRQGIEVTLNGTCDAGPHVHYTDRDKSAGFENMEVVRMEGRLYCVVSGQFGLRHSFTSTILVVCGRFSN